MAAKDYKICVTPRNAYIAKLSEDNSNIMTDDRYIIDEQDIMMLIDWYFNDQSAEQYDCLSFPSQFRKGKEVIVTCI